MSINVRYVVNHPDGWAVKAGKAERASGVYNTQYEAIEEAKKIVKNLGGGEVRIQGENGKFRDAITVSPGNDPFPPRG